MVTHNLKNTELNTTYAYKYKLIHPNLNMKCNLKFEQ